LQQNQKEGNNTTNKTKTEEGNSNRLLRYNKLENKKVLSSFLLHQKRK
jgi:hypothetical protein